jgi:hypothetical protein
MNRHSQQTSTLALGERWRWSRSGDGSADISEEPRRWLRALIGDLRRHGRLAGHRKGVVSYRLVTRFVGVLVRQADQAATLQNRR